MGASVLVFPLRLFLHASQTWWLWFGTHRLRSGVHTDHAANEIRHLLLSQFPPFPFLFLETQTDAECN
jgi:hypothetical protein